MKRGISLITSLMMTASVFGGAASQAFTASPAAIVSAASEKPVIGIGDSALKGTTKVPYGTKKVKIPVVITANDLCAVVMDVRVESDKSGEADPKITAASGGKYEVMINEATGNTRRIVWTTSEDDGTLPLAPVFDNTVLTYVEVTLPYDSNTSEDSTYTVTIDQKTLDPSDAEENADYSFDADASDFTEKIVFEDLVQDDYTLSFAEEEDGKWNSTKKMYVEAGKTANVGLNIKSPTMAIGALVYDFGVDKDAVITGVTAGDNLPEGGEFEFGDKLNVVWTYNDWEGYKFKDETHLLTVDVDIPADAKPGTKYILSMTSQDTSTSPEEIDIIPVSLPEIELIVKGDAEPVETFIDLVIGTVELDAWQETVEVPVFAKNGDATAIVAGFEAENGAKVVGVKEAGVVGGEVVANAAGNMATWTNDYSSELVDYKFSEDGDKIFILTVELPKDSEETEFPVVFNNDVTDVANANEQDVTVNHTNGKIIIKRPVVTTVTTEVEPAPTLTTVASVTTTVSSYPIATESVTTIVTEPTVTTVTEPIITTTVTEPIVTTTVTEPIVTTTVTEPIVTTTVTEPTVTTVTTVTEPIITTTVTEPTVTTVTTVTEPIITTTVTEPIVTTTVTEPVVTTEPIVTTPPVITLPPSVSEVEVVIPNDESAVIPSDYKPEFYYEHEKEFSRLDEDFTITIKVKKNTPDKSSEEGYTTEELDVVFTKDDIVFPEDITPKTVYNEKQFKYEVPVTLSVANIKTDDKIDQSVLDAISKSDITVKLPVFIGMLGDITLDHAVAPIDSTFIARERLIKDVENGSVMEEKLSTNEAAKAELGEYMLEFAYFLSDVNMNGKEYEAIDSTYVKRACLVRDVEGFDTKRVPEEVWISIGIIE